MPPKADNAKAKALTLEVRKIKDNLELFDACADKLSGPVESKGIKEKLRFELKSLNGKLSRSRLVVMDLVSSFAVGSKEKTECEEWRRTCETRMQQYLAHEASVHNKPASNQFLRQATTVSPSDVALGFLVKSIDALHRQIESAEARVEQAVAESTKAASLVEKELLGEEMVELLEMNEDRTWHVERLERVQRLLENEEVSAEKVMDIQQAITYFIESNEEGGFTIDTTLFRPLGLDADPADSKATRSPDVPHTNIHAQTEGKATDGPVDAQEEDEEDNLGFNDIAKKRSRITCKWNKQGFCHHGKDCHFQHETTDSKRGTRGGKKKPKLKMELCHKYDANGECRFGSTCIFAHGKQELYTPIEDSDYYKAPPAPSLDFSVVDFANSGKQVPVARTAKVPSSPEKDRRRKTTGSSAGNGSKGGNGGGRGKGTGSGDGQRKDATTARSAPQAADPAQQALPASTLLLPPPALVLPPPAPVNSSLVLKSSPVLPAPARPPTPDKVDPTLDGAQMVFNGPLELRSTSFCNYAERAQDCPLGPDICRFAHDPETLVLNNPFSIIRTALCGKFDSAEGCPKGDRCAFAHGNGQLRFGCGVEAAQRSGVYKTVWCDLFSTPQGCPSGRKCPFAHDKSELVGEAANESVSSAPSSVASSADSSFHSPELSSVSLRSSTLVNTFSPVIERPIPRFVGLLPLGPGACLNHFLKGSCANGIDCLSRHVVNSDDFACGLKPQLGPGFCLNHALSPSGCFNGVNCLNRHALSEDDYVSTAQWDKVRLAMDATHKFQDFSNRMNDYKQTYDGHY